MDRSVHCLCGGRVLFDIDRHSRDYWLNQPLRLVDVRSILYVFGAIDNLVGAGLAIDRIVTINLRTKPARSHQ
jgi:hypothetical protein